MATHDRDDRATVGRGTRLNGVYEIDATLGTGGMGEVYRGHNIQTGDPVAIKMVRLDMAGNESYVSLFRKEANALNRLQHEAIVRYFLFSIDPDIGRPYLAMEFVDGIALSDLLKRRSLTYDELVLLQRRIGSALHAAHRLGIIHRDVSPDNIILPNGDVSQAKIIDFGIARSTKPGDGTMIGSNFAGKYNYVSPEHLGLHGEVTAKSDIYSFALVLAEAARGQPIDMGGSQVAVIDKRRVIPVFDGVDDRIKPLIEWMLEPHPDDRPADMQEVAEWEPYEEQPRRRRWPWVAAAAVLVMMAGAGGAAFWLMRSTGDPSLTAGGYEDRPRSADERQTAGLSPVPPAQDDRPLMPPPAYDPAVPAIPPPATTAPPAPAAPAPAAVPAAPVPPPMPAPQIAVPPPTPAPAPAAEPRPAVRAEDIVGRFVPLAPAPPSVDRGQAVTAAPPPPARAAPSPRAEDFIPPIARGPEPPVPMPGTTSPDTATAPSPGRPPDPAPEPSRSADRGTRAEVAPARAPASPIEEPRERPPATPGPLAALPPATPTVRGDGVDFVRRYIRYYNGGDCFFLSSIEASATSASIEGFGAQVAPFQTFDEEFKRATGFEATISLRLLARNQCPAVSFMRLIDAEPDGNFRVDVPSFNIRQGQQIRGSVTGLGNRSLHLLLVEDDGQVLSVPVPQSAQRGRIDFAAAAASGGRTDRRPQLLVAIASSERLESISQQRPADASALFPQILAEIARRNLTIAIVPRYFRLEP